MCCCKSRSRWYKATFSKVAEEATKTAEERWHLARQIVSGANRVVALNGTVFTRGKPEAR